METQDISLEVNKQLQEYIENTILPQYKLNGKAHGIKHVKQVLQRASKISKKYSINNNILYTAVAYHDIGDHIDRKQHEIISAQIMYEDTTLNQFFNPEEKEIIKQAIEDHRASLRGEPRSVYGKILSSADKNTDINEYFERTMEYNKEHFPNSSKEENIDMAYEHAKKKFGINGYATKNNYIENVEYNLYLKQIQALI